MTRGADVNEASEAESDEHSSGGKLRDFQSMPLPAGLHHIAATTSNKFLRVLASKFGAVNAIHRQKCMENRQRTGCERHCQGSLSIPAEVSLNRQRRRLACSLASRARASRLLQRRVRQRIAGGGPVFLAIADHGAQQMRQLFNLRRVDVEIDAAEMLLRGWRGDGGVSAAQGSGPQSACRLHAAREAQPGRRAAGL